MCDQIDVEEIDFVTFEPIESHPYFYLDDPYWWSQNEQKCSNEYLESLTNMYKSIVKSNVGSSAHYLGRCTDSYNYFMYLESHPPKRFQKFLYEKLSFGSEVVDGYFNLHISGPSYLMNMIDSIRYTYNHKLSMRNTK